jgi:hypothetical protein
VIRLVTVGYPTRAVVGGAEAVAAFPESLDRDALQRLAELCTGHDDDVVVVFPAWSREPTLQRLQTVRSAMEVDRLSWHAATAPPLAGAVLVSLAAAMGQQDVRTGLVLASLPELERQLVSVTWLSRLSGLREPQPTVWQHARSLLPASRYVVTSWPQPQIRRITRSMEGLELPKPERGIGLALASHGGDRDWVWEAVVPGLGQPRLSEVEADPSSVRYWGDRRVVEAVVHPLNVSGLTTALREAVPLEACTWCGRESAASPCPFCGAADAGPAPDTGALRAD